MFFFFFENIYKHPFIKKAFEITFLDKLSVDGYCDMNEYISFLYRKVEWHRLLVKNNSALSCLYNDDRYMPTETTIEALLLQLINDNLRDFDGCRSHLDYLVEMQHYGLPTRMLDITKNPLVALYFACCNAATRYGEIILFDVFRHEVKYPRSDAVSILSSLPLLSFETKKRYYNIAKDEEDIAKFNQAIPMLLHEIHTEKPAFKSEIQQQDVLRNLFVCSLKNNRRIMKQEGAFIITGLCNLGNDSKDRYDLNSFRYTEDGKKQIIIIDKKAEIIKQLGILGITKASLFPEIDDVADDIKEKYSSDTQD